MTRKNGGLRQDFNSAYKTIRNQFRPYRPTSILGHVLTYLHRPTTDTYQELQKIPWQQLLLVKWICQDSMTNDRTGRNATPTEFDALRQRMWDLPEITDLGTRDTLPLYLFMRQMIRPQIGFQRRFTAGFVREAALLAAQPPSSSLPTLFTEKTGVTPRDFLDLAFATYAAIADGQLTLPLGWYAPLRATYGDAAVNAFIATVSRDYPSLREFLRSLPDSNRRFASEYFEFPVIARYPFLRESNQLICWHPMVFYRGMEGLVHEVLSESGHEYMSAFSKLFESHVTAQARSVPATYLSEDDLLELVPSDTQVPDALLSFPECNIFVESKAGLFDESVMVVGHNQMFAHKTKMIRKAISQGWSASTQLRRASKAPAQVLNAPRDYLLIVTNKELSAGRGTVLAGIYPEGTLDYPGEEAKRLLPLENIYVVTIEEFERLAAAARAGTITLPQLMQHCVDADRDPETSSYHFEQHLNALQLPRTCSDLVNQAIHDAEARLEVALGRTTPPPTPPEPHGADGSGPLAFAS